MKNIDYETIYCDKHGTYQGVKLWEGRAEMSGKCPPCVIEDGSKRRELEKSIMLDVPCTIQ